MLKERLITNQSARLIATEPGASTAAENDVAGRGHERNATGADGVDGGAAAIAGLEARVLESVH